MTFGNKFLLESWELKDLIINISYTCMPLSVQHTVLCKGLGTPYENQCTSLSLADLLMQQFNTSYLMETNISEVK